MNTESSTIFADTLDAFNATFVVQTTIVEGPIECHKSRLPSRETGDGLTATYSGGSLDRTESVPKWSRKRRACAGLRKASQRDKAIRSMPPFPEDSF